MIAIRIKENGRTIREEFFRDAPITVGRSADADFVLTDPTVSRSHIVIAPLDEHMWRLEDKSERGRLLLADGPASAHDFTKRATLFLGATELEVEVLSHADTQEFSLEQLRDRRRPLNYSVKVWIAGALAWMVFAVLSPSTWDPHNDHPSVKLIGLFIGGVIVSSTVSLAALIALRAVGRKIRLADTSLQVARASWALPGIMLATLVAYYIVPVDKIATASSALISLGLSIAVALLATTRRGQHPVRFGVIWGLCFFGVLTALDILATQSRNRYDPQLHTEVLPPLGSYAGPSTSLDEHFIQVEQQARELRKSQ